MSNLQPHRQIPPARAVGIAAAIALGVGLGAAAALGAAGRDVDLAGSHLVPRLRAAHGAGDADELARSARLIGAAGLAPLLRLSPIAARPIVVAAIAAAPEAEDAHLVLPALAAVAAGPDRSLAVPAARVAARIAARLDGDAALALDVAPDELGAGAAAWRAIAESGGRWADLRVHALEIAARLSAARAALDDAGGSGAPGPAEGSPGALGYDLAALLADPDPELRRAALELLPQPLPASLRPAVAAAVRADVAPEVAAAAALALCGDLAFAGSPEGSGGPTRTAAAPLLAALGDTGRARLRTLAARPDPGATPLAAPALLAIARCLAADRDSSSHRAFRGLQSALPRSMRRELSRIAP